MKKESYSPESVLHGDYAFMNKIMVSRPTFEQYSPDNYFSDTQSLIPFNWEEKPGLLKKKPSIIFNNHPPAKSKCSKATMGNMNDEVVEESSISLRGDIFSSHHVLKSSSRPSTASSKELHVFKFLRILKFAKGIYKRFF